MSIFTYSINFNFGDNFESSPNWFDWLTLFLTVGSIFATYIIVLHIFNREKTLKEADNLKLQNLEVALFENNLPLLNEALKKQIQSLTIHLRNRDFSIEIHLGIQTEFLNSINFRDLYSSIGLENDLRINELNILITSIFSLKDITPSLRGQFRAYMDKYAIHEHKFYNYRKLLYTQHQKLCNQRCNSIEYINGIKKISMITNDLFMINYNQLLSKVFSDPEIISENILISNKLLVERFIIPLIEISKDFSPEDIDAIEVIEIANTVNTAFKDLENIANIHYLAIESYNAVMKNCSEKIEKYLTSSP